MYQDLQIEENVKLAPLTTLKVGGDARFFVRAETGEQVAEAVCFARTRDLELFVLGGGSNVVVSDGGFDGLVLQVAPHGISLADAANRKVAEDNIENLIGKGRSALVTGMAGENWDQFVSFCVERDLAGIECLSGIPGFVGGTPVQNVGAYGQEVSETIVSVGCFDRDTSTYAVLTNADCGFSYRTSIFNSTERNRYIVLSVTYNLVYGEHARVEYPELKRLIELSIQAEPGPNLRKCEPSLRDVREAVLKVRRSKSMVIDHADPNSYSVGSFFKNPIVGQAKFREITTMFERVPHFAFGNGFKIPAAWLIETAGFEKGFVLGNAGISVNHTLAIINCGNGSAGEIIALRDKIQETVLVKFGIELQPEPVFVGF